MSLEEIIAARQTGSGGSLLPPPEPDAGTAAGEEPWGVAEVVTPSGLNLYYQAGPKRLYRVDGVEVPSVSEVLQVLEKGGLSWWGMKVGIEGARCFYDEVGAREASTEVIVDWLKEKKLTVNHVRDRAAKRGTSVHDALELYATDGVMPDPELFPAHERGYVAGLVAFLNDAHPRVFVSEMMVASKEIGYAGRFDLVANLDYAGEVVTKTYPKKTPIRSAVNGTWMLDLKTSKGVYASYHVQLAAYLYALYETDPELARNIDYQGVVRVTDDGRYELVEGRATPDHWLNVYAAYQSIREIEGKT